MVLGRTRYSVLALLWLLLACAPSQAPPPAPTPAAATPPAAPAPKSALSPTAEEAAWARVSAEARKEGKLTLYSFAFTGDIGRAMARAFEDKFGIRTEIVTGIGTTLIERLKTEQAAKRFIADTLDTSVTLVMIGKQEGVTQPMGELPVLRQRDVWVADPRSDAEGHIVAMRSSTFTPYINTNLIKPEETPRSFRELLEPKWKKKIVIGNPVTVPSVVWIYLTYKKTGALDDDYWRRLALQELIFAPTTRDVPGLVSRADGAISMPTADSTSAPLVKEGAAIKAVEFDEGAMVVPQSTGIALARNAPNPNAARLFVNWLLSQEGQTIYAQAVGGLPPLRKDVADIRPASLKTAQRKVAIVDLAIQEETTRVQREGTVNRLLGLGR